MSKALSYKDALTIMRACTMAGAEMPSFQWFMGRRRSENWQSIIDSAETMVSEATFFQEILAEDREQYEKGT